MSRKYGKLREMIGRKFGTQPQFAVAMGIDRATLTAKLNGKTDWKAREIEKAVKLLEIPIMEIPDYFFYS